MTSVRKRGAFVPLTDEFVAFGYKRVSSDDQEKDGMSLPVQDKEILAEMARHESWTFGGMFEDVQTGTNPSRADYQRMLAAARAATAAGKRVAIVAVRQNRLGRDGEEALRALKELVRLDAQLWATRDGGHLDDPLMYGIRAVLAEHDVRQISENVRATFAEIRSNGWLKPGRPRWGYAWVPATPEQRQAQGAPTVVPVPHETEADAVRELFRRRADGTSLRGLVAWARTLPVAVRGGRELSFSAIKDVLGSPVYIARNPELGQDALDAPLGRWQPLCDDATWRAIHPRAGTRENVVPAAARGEFALTGFLFCEVCGARMCGQTNKGAVRRRVGRQDYRPRDRRVYICSSRMSGASQAAKPCYRTIGADLIEGRVFGILTHVLDVLKDPRMQAAVRKAASEMDDRESATGSARRLRNAEQERARLVAERVGLTRSLSAGIIDGEAYAEAVAVVAAELSKQDAEIARLGTVVAGQARRASERPQIDVILGSAEQWSWALVAGDVEAKRAFLRLVLERATPRRIRAGEYVANAWYTPLGWKLFGVGVEVLEGAGQMEVVQQAWANCSTSTRPDGLRATA